MKFLQHFKNKGELLRIIESQGQRVQQLEGILAKKLWDELIELDQSKIYVIVKKEASADDIQNLQREITRLKRYFPYTMPNIIFTNQEPRIIEKQP